MQDPKTAAIDFLNKQIRGIEEFQLSIDTSNNIGSLKHQELEERKQGFKDTISLLNELDQEVRFLKGGKNGKRN